MQKKGKSTSKAANGKPVKKSKKSSSCPFLDTKRIQFVRDLSLIEIADIESLVNIGRKEKACPYYAARNALSDAQVHIYTRLLMINYIVKRHVGILGVNIFCYALFNLKFR